MPDQRSLHLRLELMRWATRILTLRDQGKVDTDEYREAVRRRDEARQALRELAETEQMTLGL
ncbi:hypothetical protein [Alicyclobacillus macrosporangiidus]|uniref:Uncharacterized protein n=1 Tax=Alicyclobacillus macrosporangiidus TaxID=392015 RepID=A0A1I7ICM8_9BACL|nr:hypothetical protein [Alicyclobacillus macrosporangiidus]SFU70616.1 hypothetical protein SAMN05421543_106131 [Alicyclobacillus macrosporangiidus]